MSKIQERAMIIKFEQGKWGAKVRDVDAEDYISKEKYGAKGKVGNFYKKLMPDYVSKINSIFSQAYIYHQEQTVPYDRKGRSIIMNTNYLNYVGRMNLFQAEIDSCLAEMIENYDEEIELEKKRLNKGFKESDYPTKEEIQSSYRLSIDPEPIPTGSIYNEELDDAENKRINDMVEKRVEERLQQGMGKVWERVAKVLANMLERLSNPDSRIYDTLITNIEELCDTLPHLNVANDPHLEEIRQEMLNKLTKISSDTLRDNPTVRKSTAKEAHDILTKMFEFI
jgi:hypothetical protein